MLLSELDYELPEELIAQRPTEDRVASRLLYSRASGPLLDHRFSDLPKLLAEPVLFVANDTKVIPARLFGQKASGGKVEMLLIEKKEAATSETPYRERWLAMLRSSRAPKPGTVLSFGALEATVLGREEALFDLELRTDGRLPSAVIAEQGEIPLPPYIERDVEEDDADRYQTVFAEEEGAVAAPTAGLHFSNELIEELRSQGHRFAQVTLHVGPGTFRPVKVENLDEHPMHEERYIVSSECADAIAQARAEGRRVLAIGTTVVRTLESAALEDGLVRVGEGRTRLFIKPPYRPKVVDHLITNFHLPKSTLLALVMALRGTERVRETYAHAVRERYRFFSYGDAMLLTDLRFPS